MIHSIAKLETEVQYHPDSGSETREEDYYH